MSTAPFTSIINTTKTTQEVFAAITNVAQWWTENFEGSALKLNDEFKVTFGETFIKLKVVQLVNDRKVVWQVLDCYKHFLKNKKECLGTNISFFIEEEDSVNTKITFTHLGLSSPLECYEICCNAWNNYLQSLKRLIDTGTGTPDKKAA